MKSHLNLTIDDNLLKKMKVYAEKRQASLSELVESYFKEVIQTTQKESFMDVVEGLGSHSINPKADLKELYYHEQKHTVMGFK
jgi:Family of unknown function (DUF6364)